MNKLAITAAASMFGWVGALATPSPDSIAFKEERVTVEYNATLGEVALRVEAEAEAALVGLEVRDPRGAPVLRLEGGAGAALALSAFVVESREMTLDELRSEHPPGHYAMRGTTSDGGAVFGGAELTFELPAAATIVYPPAGAVGVPAGGFELRWTADASAVGFELSLEQGESDTMKVSLPGDARSFEVPKGFLVGGTETHVEVVAVGSRGNRTVVEQYFTTR